MASMNQKLKELVRRVEMWPDEAQEELAQLGLEIEAERVGAAYHATPAELAAIDEADRSGIATEAEVATTLAKFRRG